MRVLLVDDHALFVEALKNMLITSNIEVVGTASDGFEALTQVRTHKPDVVLMDIRMPGCSGLEGTRLIKAQFPDVKVVMLTMSADDNDLFEAVKSGASGYILKSVRPEELLDLLAGLNRGEAAISRGLANRIMAEFARSSGRDDARATDSTAAAQARNDDNLTPRQLDVLGRVAQGCTYKEIAEELKISERTVEYHMAEILNKLHLRNRAQVIAYAERKGLTRSTDSDVTF